MKLKNAYHYLMLNAKKLEASGEFWRASEDYYEALQSALYDLMLSVSSDLARAAQEGRARCFRQMAARNTSGGDHG